MVFLSCFNVAVQRTVIIKNEIAFATISVVMMSFETVYLTPEV